MRQEPIPILLASVCNSHGCVGSDRKSTRLNSSHLVISYAVFCLKKKKDSFLLRWVPRLVFHTASVIRTFLCLRTLLLIAVYISLTFSLCCNFHHAALILLLVVS